MNRKTHKWKRNCPKCGKELLYSSRKGLWNANNVTSKCYQCRNGQSHPHSLEWKKKLSQLQTTEGISFFYKARGCTKREEYREKRHCLQCLIEMDCLKTSKRKFCSVKCCRVFQTKRITKKCSICGNDFNTKNKFCSKNCGYLFYRDKNTRRCIFCKKEIQGYRKFCSKKCSGAHRRVPLEEKYCKMCNNKFTNRQKKVKFCCHRCSVIYCLRYGDRISKPEKDAGKILKSINIPYVSSYAIGTKIFDYYLPTKNILLEIDGIYWHAKYRKKLTTIQQKNIINDKLKNKIAKNGGYKLIRMWEDEVSIKNIERLLCI